MRRRVLWCLAFALGLASLAWGFARAEAMQVAAVALRFAVEGWSREPA